MSFKLRTALSIAAALGAVIATSAHAQQPPPVAPPMPAPPMNCPNPGNPPLDRGGAEGPRFQKRIDAYKDCIQAYSQANIAKANALVEQAHVYNDAANKAVDEFNAYVADNNLNGKSPAK